MEMGPPACHEEYVAAHEMRQQEAMRQSPEVHEMSRIRRQTLAVILDEIKWSLGWTTIRPLLMFATCCYIWMSLIPWWPIGPLSFELKWMINCLRYSLTRDVLHAVRIHGSDDDHRELYRARSGGTLARERQDATDHRTGKLNHLAYIDLLYEVSYTVLCIGSLLLGDGCYNVAIYRRIFPPLSVLDTQHPMANVPGP